MSLSHIEYQFLDHIAEQAATEFFEKTSYETRLDVEDAREYLLKKLNIELGEEIVDEYVDGWPTPNSCVADEDDY